MRHLIVCRFSVPRQDAATAPRHGDPEWLGGRIDLFRRYFVPSVGRLGVPVTLLCSTASAPWVAERTRDLTWTTVEVQNDWRGGSRTSADWVTRFDSDDALAEGWFEAVERCSASTEVAVTRRFYRLDARANALYAYRRREPSPLAAFRSGVAPFAYDHKDLDRHRRCEEIAEPYLLQVVHGGNLSSRAPRWWRFRPRQPLALLERFGLG